MPRANKGVNSPSLDPLDQLYGLTIRQGAFVQHYLVHQNAALSAVKAGYALKTARSAGENILSQACIQEALSHRRQVLALETGVTAQDVINELKKVAFANMEDYMTVDDEGAPRLDLSKITRGHAAALAEVSTERYVEGKGKDAVPVKKSKVKFHDKIAALVNLGKHLGLFADRQEHTGPDGGPILVAQRWQVELVPCPTPNHQAPPSVIQ